MRIIIALLFIAASLAIVPSGNAQIHNCGDLNIIFLNPDLQPGNDGIIRASGDFFAQFQVIGDRADEVDNIGFSFGVDTVPFDESSCNEQGLYFTGQQLQNYRADTNPDDGFFINLQTALVPDGPYTAAVHAYDADDNEIARFWARAIVENCDTDTVPTVQRCNDDPAQMVRNDRTMPWPIVLPGDGQVEFDGFSLEFAEALSELKVTLNGEDITDQLESWEGRLWDNDLKPGYGPFGLLGDTPLTAECNTTLPEIPQVHNCDYLGEAYKWNVRALTDDDVLRIEARDLAGIPATKDVHVGSGVTGGAISANIPILEWQVDRAEATVAPGELALFKFTIRNSGGATGHPFADQEMPAGWNDFEWSPPHTPVESGAEEDQELAVTPPLNATAGTYNVVAYMNYQQGEIEKRLQQLIRITVTGDDTGLGEDGGDGGEPEPKKKSPGPAVPALIGLAAVAAARRRQN